VSRHSAAREASRLDSRLQALDDARGLGEGVLPDQALEEVLAVLDRAGSRRSLSADHTVVGFFGATGSGKSSLFNAVSGAEIATAAARRPTTSEPLAGVWGADGSGPLLDWLEVRNRHHAAAVDGFADEETGLILLDLPDFDSTREANREVVQRMVGLVDVLVWVLDPQKYADAAVHHGFLAPLASHGAVTLVVLNQVDRLPATDVEPVLESLRSQAPASIPCARPSAPLPSSAGPSRRGWPPMFPRQAGTCGQPRGTGKRPGLRRRQKPGWLKNWQWPRMCRLWSEPLPGPTGWNQCGGPAGPSPGGLQGSVRTPCAGSISAAPHRPN
jgi:energy-coupling factor transporter ATP-binding protein EcfA2